MAFISCIWFLCGMERIKKFLETRFKQNGSSHITYIEYTVEPTNKIQQHQQDPISIVLHVIIWWTNSPKSAWFASKAAWKPWRCWNLCPEPERNGGRLRRDMVPCWKGDKQCWKGDFMWFPHGFHGFHIPWYLAMTREHHEQRGQVCQLIISDLDLWEPDHEFPWPLEVMEEIHKVMDCVCLPCSPWWSSMNLMLYRMIRMILQELFATKGGGCLKIQNWFIIIFSGKNTIWRTDPSEKHPIWHQYRATHKPCKAPCAVMDRCDCLGPSPTFRASFFGLFCRQWSG